VTQRRAFWEAVLTVAGPSFLIWAAAFALLVARDPTDLGLVLLFLILFALPLPLIIPIYHRYLKGPQARKPATPRQEWLWTICFVVLAALQFGVLFEEHSHGWRLVFRLAMVVCWLMASVQHAKGALRARKDDPDSFIHELR